MPKFCPELLSTTLICASNQGSVETANLSEFSILGNAISGKMLISPVLYNINPYINFKVNSTLKNLIL